MPCPLCLVPCTFYQSAIIFLYSKTQLNLGSIILSASETTIRLNHTIMKRSFLSATGLMLLLLISAMTFGQGYCDSTLLQSAQGTLGYGPRGDRCEGIYAKPVGSTTLLVASFTSFFDDFKAGNGQALTISWKKPPTHNKVHIRVQGVKRHLYYRMDTVHPPDSSTYRWPSNVLASLNVGKKDIGIVGTTTLKLGETEKEIYLPVTLNQGKTTVTETGFHLLLLPGMELKEVYVSLAVTGADGKPAKWIKKAEKLGYGYYPAERAIGIPIKRLPEPGIYTVEIGATLINGGSASFNLWFYNGK